MSLSAVDSPRRPASPAQSQISAPSDIWAPNAFRLFISHTNAHRGRLDCSVTS